jgi:hypothetical protein
MSTQNQPYLFYSKRCANSAQVIETLKALNKAGLYKFIEVESLGREQIAKLPFQLSKVPTLYITTTKEAIVGKDIYGYIAKPTNARNDIPSKEGSVGNSAPDAPIGNLSPWGFEGSGKLTESYASWNTPTSFVSDGNSMYTFLGGAQPMMTGGADIPVEKGPATKNTLDDKSKTGSNEDVKARMEMMQKQRETEFSQIERK